MTDNNPDVRKPLILIAEDVESNYKLLEIILKKEYDLLWAKNGREAVDFAMEHKPDAILMDIKMPVMDGIEATKRIEAQHPIPVLMLTARDDEADVVIGLGVGADDYMSKPFSMRELVARVRALLRRVDRAKVIAHKSENDCILDFGTLVIDPAKRQVTLDGKEVHLTPTEFDLLTTLAKQPHSVLTREQLLEEVWDWVDASSTRTVDSHVKALRHKLGASTIRTVHGVGYAFEPPEA